MAFAMVACGGGSNPVTPGPDPVVNSVTISPKFAVGGGPLMVALSGTQTFTVAVSVSNGASQAVNWSIEETGKKAGTTIVSATATTATLTVAADEALETLTVKATSTANTGKFDTATVVIYDSSQPYVSNVVVSGPLVALQGGTETYTATVTAHAGAAETVTWTLEGATETGTSIDEDTGVLTVDADEPADTVLKVIATSTVTTAISGFVNVTVVDPNEPYVSAVVVTPNPASVGRNRTQQFAAAVTAHNSAAETVIWSIVETGKHANTTISTTGLLSINNAETLTTLTVKAVSTVTPSIYGEAVVTVTAPTVVVNFYLENPVGTQTPYAIRTVPEATAIPFLQWPTTPTKDGYSFGGWYNLAGTQKFTSAPADLSAGGTPFDVNTNLFAVWYLDVLTADADPTGTEVLYLENGAVALYQFDLPQGKTLANYDTISFEVKASEAALGIMNDGGIRHTRIYGVYVDGETISVSGTTKFYNLNNYNAPWILNGGPGASTVVDSLAGGVTEGADKWFTITQDLRGQENAGNTANKADATKSGTVYLGVGITCQTSAGGSNMEQQFIQLVKNVKLNKKADSQASDLTGRKPVAPKPAFPTAAIDVPELVAYENAGILWAWRTTADADTIANWRTLRPQLEADDFERTPVPAIESLAKVNIHTNNFTYDNRGNGTNQKGWVSFEEAGRANDQVSTNSSIVTFADFKNAWYLDLTVTTLPASGLSVIWVGAYGGWNQAAVSDNNGALTEGKAESIDNGDGTYTIRIFLPNALLQYGKYFNNNTEWAGLILQYYGPSNTGGITTLGLSKAELLVESAAGTATGVSLAIESKLGDAPPSGNVIDEVTWAKTSPTATKLVITTVGDLSNYRWYKDGVYQNSANAGTFEIDPVSAGQRYNITVQALRNVYEEQDDGSGGTNTVVVATPWVSQSVDVKLKATN